MEAVLHDLTITIEKAIFEKQFSLVFGIDYVYC